MSLTQYLTTKWTSHGVNVSLLSTSFSKTVRSVTFNSGFGDEATISSVCVFVDRVCVCSWTGCVCVCMCVCAVVECVDVEVEHSLLNLCAKD